MKRRTLILASLAASAAGGAGAQQTFPSQPVKVVVPFPPGGGTDALARAIQEPMQKALGQTVVIDNKGGAGGALAHDYVAKQESVFVGSADAPWADLAAITEAARKAPPR